MWDNTCPGPAAVAPPAVPYEARLRAASCALARRVRVEFPLFCKDPEKVAELVALEDVLNEAPSSMVVGAVQASAAPSGSASCDPVFDGPADEWVKQ